ncbi:hypothetical protein D3C76_1342070 [compost metagenome]
MSTRVPYRPAMGWPITPGVPVPFSWPVRMPVTVSPSPPSTSLSLGSTLPLVCGAGTWSLAKLASSRATGLSLAPWMVTVRRASEVAPAVSRMR